MKFLYLFGPPAVGKMTIGHELEKITNLKLFSNHETIELTKRFLPYGDPHFGEMVEGLRMTFFQVISKTDTPGIIFTAGTDFACPPSVAFMDRVCQMFEKNGAEIYHVELITDLTTRLERNKSEHRLAHKPSKRDIAESEKRMLDFEKESRFNTLPGEFSRKNYLRIDNTHLSAKEVAQQIRDYVIW